MYVRRRRWRHLVIGAMKLLLMRIMALPIRLGRKGILLFILRNRQIEGTLSGSMLINIPNGPQTVNVFPKRRTRIRVVSLRSIRRMSFRLHILIKSRTLTSWWVIGWSLALLRTWFIAIGRQRRTLMVPRIVQRAPLLRESTRVRRNRHGPLKCYVRKRPQKGSLPLFVRWDRGRVILGSPFGSRHSCILMVRRLLLFARRR